MKVAYLAENLGRVDRAWSRDAGGLMHHTGHNVGNLAFWYATRLLFDADIHLVGRTTRAHQVPDDVEVLVIPAANFLNAGADLSALAELVCKLDRPCLVVGLGAQAESEDTPPSLRPGTLDFLREVAARSPQLCVRGPFTESVCQSHGVANTRVLGCPSVLINPKQDLGRRIAARIAALPPAGPVAVHAACIKSVVMAVERELVRVVRLAPGSCYVVQRPIELVKAAYDEPLSEAEGQALAKATKFLGFGEDIPGLAAFLRAHMIVPDSIDGWVHHLRRFTMALNTRIHGTLMSVAAGVPTICICHDTRTRELAAFLRLPHLTVRQFIDNRYAAPDLFAAASFDGEAFDNGRREIAAGYVEAVKAAGLKPSAHLRSFLDA